MQFSSWPALYPLQGARGFMGVIQTSPAQSRAAAPPHREKPVPGMSRREETQRKTQDMLE